MESTKKKYNYKTIPPCEYCGRAIRFTGTLERHKQNHRIEDESQLEIQKLEQEGTCPRIFTCTRCQRKFLTAMKMHTHRDYLCQYSPSSVAQCWSCESCQKIFDSEKGLSVHKGKCQAYTVSSDALMGVRCEKCDQTFETDHLLKQHMRIHTLGTDNMCIICDKPFKTTRALKQHMTNIHTNGKKFKCFECNKPFYSKFNMMSHYQIHHVFKGEKRFVCDICGKAVISKKNLQRHYETHSDIRHKCVRCGRSYKQKRHLANHKCVKKFQHLCPNCGLAFKGTQPFKKHQATCCPSSKQTSVDEETEEKRKVAIMELLNREEEGSVKVTRPRHLPADEWPGTKVIVTEPQIITESYVGDTMISCTLEIMTDGASTTAGEQGPNIEVPETAVSEQVPKTTVPGTVQEAFPKTVPETVPGTAPQLADNKDTFLQNLAESVAAEATPDQVVIWQCVNCFMHFEKLENFQEHAQTCKKENVEKRKSNEEFCCMECSLVFTDVTTCIKHIHTHTQRQCVKCYKTLLDENALEDHLKVDCPFVMTEMVVYDVEKQECNYCRQKFATRKRLEKHLEVSEMRTQNNDVKCQCCSREFTKHCQLVAHRMKFKYTCKTCQVHYTHQVMFARHIKRHHRNGQSPGGDICGNCDQKFKSVEELKQHLDYSTRVTNDIELKCFQCGMQFSNKDELEEHSLSYEQCSYCGFHVPRSKRCEKSQLGNHYLKTHLEKEHNVTDQLGVEERPRNRCRHCNLCFEKAWQLGEHVKQVLENSKALACTWERDTIMCLRCGLRYDEHSKLVEHLKKYRFNCSECNMHFRNHRYLWMHMESNGHYPNGGGAVDKEDANWKVVRVQKSDLEGNKLIKVEGDNAESRNDDTTTHNGESEDEETNFLHLEVHREDNSDQNQEFGEEKQKTQERKKSKKVKKLSSSLPDVGQSEGNLDVTTSTKNSTKDKSRDNISEKKGRRRSRKDAKKIPLPPGRQRRPYKQKFRTERVECGYCGVLFRTQHRVKIHIKSYHRSGVCNWRSIKNDQTQCNYCQRIFSGPSMANYHIFRSESEMNGELLECGVCGKILSAKCEVEFHAKECEEKRDEDTHGAKKKRRSHSTKRNSAKKVAREESPEPENYAMSPDWNGGEECDTPDPELQQPTMDGSISKKLKHKESGDNKLIKLDPDVYYMVKFPQGMLADVVSAKDKQVMMHGSDNTTTSKSCVVPVISVKPLSNSPSPTKGAKTTVHVTRATNTEESLQETKTLPSVEARSNKSSSDSTTVASGKICKPPDSSSKTAVASFRPTTRSQTGSSSVGGSALAQSEDTAGNQNPQVVVQNNSVIISIPENTSVTLSSLVAVGSAKIFTCTFMPITDQNKQCKKSSTTVPLPKGYKMQQPVARKFNPKSGGTVLSIVLTKQ